MSNKKEKIYLETSVIRKIEVKAKKGYVNRYDRLLGEIDRIRIKDDMKIADRIPKDVVSYYRERAGRLIDSIESSR